MNNDIAMFPILEFTQNDTTGEITHHKYVSDGTTLRDYFAAKALEGICARNDTWGLSVEQLADKAFVLSDAMLKARNK